MKQIGNKELYILHEDRYSPEDIKYLLTGPTLPKSKEKAERLGAIDFDGCFIKGILPNPTNPWISSIIFREISYLDYSSKIMYNLLKDPNYRIKAIKTILPRTLSILKGIVPNRSEEGFLEKASDYVFKGIPKYFLDKGIKGMERGARPGAEELKSLISKFADTCVCTRSIDEIVRLFDFDYYICNKLVFNEKTGNCEGLKSKYVNGKKSILIANGEDKAAGLRKIVSNYNSLIVFGESREDIPMFKIVDEIKKEGKQGLKIALDHSNLKETCDLLIKSNDFIDFNEEFLKIQ